MKGKKKKLIPNSTIKKEMEFTSFRSNGTSEHRVRGLFTEKIGTVEIYAKQ